MTKLTRIFTLLLALVAFSFAACSGSQPKTDGMKEEMKSSTDAPKKTLNKNTGKNMERAEEDE